LFPPVVCFDTQATETSVCRWRKTAGWIPEAVAGLRILSLDIETRPVKAWVWSMYDQVVNIEICEGTNQIQSVVVARAALPRGHTGRCSARCAATRTRKMAEVLASGSRHPDTGLGCFSVWAASFLSCSMVY